MSAQVETMMYAAQTPWHGEGVYVGDDNVDSRTAIRKAGLDWDVLEKPLFFQDTSIVGTNVNDLIKSGGQLETRTENILVPSHKALVRSTDNRQLGIVGKGYVPLQNQEAFTFLDGLVGSGDMRYHTAGSLRGGKRVWLLGKISDFEVVPNDKIDNYILLYNTHDGTGCLRVLFTQTRVVCANTVRLALSNGKNEGMKVRHTKNMQINMEIGKKVLNLGKKAFAKEADFLSFLSKQIMTVKMWDNFLDAVFPVPVDESKKRGITTANLNRAKLTELFESGIGQDIKGVKGTSYAAYNAITEYSNFYRPTRSSGGSKGSRFEAAMFGTGNDFVQKAMDCLSGVE